MNGKQTEGECGVDIFSGKMMNVENCSENKNKIFQFILFNFIAWKMNFFLILYPVCFLYIFIFRS